MRYLHFNRGQNTDVNRSSRIIPDILNDLTLAVILEKFFVTICILVNRN